MTYFSQIKELQQKNENLAQMVAELARKKGADQAKIMIFAGKGVEVSTRNCDIENVDFNQDQSMNIVIYKDHKSASASTGDLSPEAIDAALDSALNLCNYTAPDEFAGLCDPELLYTGNRDLQLLYEIEEDPDKVVAQAIALEKEAIEQIASHPLIESSDGVSYDNSYAIRTMATTTGFINSTVESNNGKFLTLVGSTEQGKQKGSGYSVHLDYHKLYDNSKIVEEAIAKTEAKLNARKVKTGSYNVILTERAARSLIKHLVSGMSGSAIYQESSFLCGKLGEQIFPDFINIKEDPWIVAKTASASYDADGVATYPQDIIADGKLCTYLLGTYSARKLKMKHNAHTGGIYNWFVDAGSEHTRDFDSLLKEVGSGLVLDTVFGPGVNITSGNYSRGASGYYFENGQRQYAVEEITIASTIQEMFSSIALVGNDYDERSSIQVGSIFIPNITVSGD